MPEKPDPKCDIGVVRLHEINLGTEGSPLTLVEAWCDCGHSSARHTPNGCIGKQTMAPGVVEDCVCHLSRTEVLTA